MAKKYTSNYAYLTSQTSERLLKFASNSNSLHYEEAVLILNERLKKSEERAKKSNVELFKTFGYTEKTANISEVNLTGEQLAERFTQLIDINKVVVKEYKQNIIATNVILKGDERHPNPVIPEKYNEAIQNLINKGLTEKQAIAQLKKEGWSASSMKKMAQAIAVQNRNKGDYSVDELIDKILEGIKYDKNRSVVTKQKDTSSFRGNYVKTKK